MNRSLGSDRYRNQRKAPVKVAASNERRFALLVALGGLAVVYGSFGVWDTCPKIPCEGSFGLMSLLPRSGTGIGPGVLTAELGVLLAATGLAAFRRHGASPFRIEAIGLALMALTVVAAYVVRTYVVPEFFTYGPKLAIYVVAGGAALAAISSIRLRPSDRTARAWAVARRPALGLLVAGIGLWALAVRGHLGLRVEPLTYAVVLIGLGIGSWSGGLPGTRLRPATLGLLIILYGALSFTAIMFSDLGPGLLAALPIAIAVTLVAIVVLELPIETPRAGPATEIDAALAATRSTSGLMVLGLLLTGAAMVLLIVRLLAPDSRFFRLVLIEGAPTDPAWLIWLLAAGLGISGGIAFALAKQTHSSSTWRRADRYGGRPAP